MHFLELLLLLLLLRDHSCHDDDDDDLIHQEQAIGRLDPLVVGQYALALVKFAPFFTGNHRFSHEDHGAFL
jgi:hypothetical protein